MAPSMAETWSEAVLHALLEILGQYTAYGLVSPEGDASVDPATGEVRSFWPAFAAYFEPRADDPFAFLGDRAPVPPPEDGPRLSLEAALSGLQAELHARDLPAYI
ncbi:MAG: hypothetical protein JOZ69_19990, partial [Myxococcales bacterium]|nr:hypothetical protein [Myxococcales bacterium]